MIDLGKIKQGERGTLTITWEFPDSLTAPASISGATITATMQSMDGSGAVTAVSGTLTATGATTATWALSAGDSGTAGTFHVTFRADVSGTPTYTLNAALEVEENPAATAVQNPALVGISSAEAAWVTAGKTAVPDAADLVDANDLGTAAYAATGDFDAAGSAAAVASDLDTLGSALDTRLDTLEAALVPAAVSTLTATPNGSAAIDLAWTYTAVAPITGFKIYRKTGAGAYSLIDTAADDATSYADSGLSPETAYTYRVDACNTFFVTTGNEDTGTTAALQPDDIASLLLWLDASAITGLSDGQAVATWADKSGNGLNATQATGTKQPTYKTNILNGHPVIRFDGGDGLVTPTIDWSGAGAATVIMVLKDANSGEHMYIELSPTYSGNEGTFIFYKLTSDRVFTSANMTSGSPPFTSRRLASTTKFNIMSAIFDFTQTETVPTYTTDNSVIGFIDGLRSDGGEGGGVGGYMAPNPAEIADGFSLYIGARNQSNTYFTGDMAEVIVFAERLTPTQRAQLTKYLNAKYGITYDDGMIVYLGDSMTAGDNATSPYPYQLDTLLIGGGYDFNYGNYGRNGTQSNDVDDYADESDPFYDLNGGRSIAVVWAGTNDLRFNQSLATLQSRVQTLCQNRKAIGWETWVLTMLPRSDVGTPGTFEANRQAFNSWLLANYTSFADGVVDVASDARLDDETDATYYSGDLVHLSNTGLAVVAELVKTAIAP